MDALDQTKQSLTSLAMDVSAIVLPIMQQLLTKVRDEVIPVIKRWVGWWTDLDSGTKQIIVTLGAAVAAIGLSSPSSERSGPCLVLSPPS
jgi:hypothetical protein